MNLHRKVSISVLMCAPSISASHIMMILEYLSLLLIECPSSSLLFPLQLQGPLSSSESLDFGIPWRHYVSVFQRSVFFHVEGESPVSSDPYQFSQIRPPSLLRPGIPHIRSGLWIDSPPVCLEGHHLLELLSFESGP